MDDSCSVAAIVHIALHVYEHALNKYTGEPASRAREKPIFLPFFSSRVLTWWFDGDNRIYRLVAASVIVMISAYIRHTSTERIMWVAAIKITHTVDAALVGFRIRPHRASSQPIYRIMSHDDTLQCFTAFYTSLFLYLQKKNHLFSFHLQFTCFIFKMLSATIFFTLWRLCLQRSMCREMNDEVRDEILLSNDKDFGRYSDFRIIWARVIRVARNKCVEWLTTWTLSFAILSKGILSRWRNEKR